jgi:putative colanic acid biosynthesis UDP-glucose lipid carrier transferase
MSIVPTETFSRAPSSLPGALPVASSRGKRAFDVSAAGGALLLFLPLLLLVALAIWLESGGPVLFRQARGGLNGRPFAIYKFRTLTVAEDGSRVRQVTADDVRATRVGRVLRRLSIDELPQLLNVLKGEMSLVGPRPHALAHDAQWMATVPGYEGRFRARPGLTGYAQVIGCRGLIHDFAAIRARVAADNDYVEGWSFGRDIALILRTVPLVFSDPAAF